MSNFRTVEQTWVYIAESTTFVNIGLATSFWIIICMLVTLIPLPKYNALKSSEGKPVPMTKEEILDTQKRIVSFTHGIMCIVLSFYDITYLNLPCGSPNHPMETFLATMSMGYFLYDLLAMTHYGSLGQSMIIHHSICWLGYYLALSFKASATEIIGGVYISEISNPAMHLRLISRNFGYRHTKFYESCEYSYIFLYVYYRLFKGVFVVWNCAGCNGNHPILKICSLGLAVQSYFFIYRMLLILKGRYRDLKQREKVGIKLHWFSHNKEVEKCEYYAKCAKKDGIP